MTAPAPRRPFRHLGTGSINQGPHRPRINASSLPGSSILMISQMAKAARKIFSRLFRKSPGAVPIRSMRNARGMRNTNALSS